MCCGHDLARAPHSSGILPVEWLLIFGRNKFSILFGVNEDRVIASRLGFDTPVERYGNRILARHRLVALKRQIVPDVSLKRDRLGRDDSIYRRWIKPNRIFDP